MCSCVSNWFIVKDLGLALDVLLTGVTLPISASIEVCSSINLALTSTNSSMKHQRLRKQ